MAEPQAADTQAERQAAPPSHLRPIPRMTSFSQLSPIEEYWRDHHSWLKEHGYELRPRYRSNWVPSWKINRRKFPIFCEDSWTSFSWAAMDAVRLHDNTRVMLKRIPRNLHPDEVAIWQFFADLGPSPANHCVPLFEVLHPPDDPNMDIAVMPVLRRLDSPRFDSFGEAVECFRQIFEGLQFMHHHNVAHLDANYHNIMMDGDRLYPGGFHPHIVNQDRALDGKSTARHYTRTRKPVKYYFIDFGLSRRYTPEQVAAPGGLWEPIIKGGDKTPPEHNEEGRFEANPFATDIYYVGNVIRQHFTEGFEDLYKGRLGFEFMGPLVKDMVQDDPAKRPNIDEVVSRFAEIQKSLNPRKLRSRVLGKKEFPYIPHYVVGHWYRRIRSIVFRTPACPAPSY
ncbi:hypothetical protein C8F01DRAFT_1243039 [Mycena amicta]|nr:hypothetical protein C8F01DRAFT_1243039 [Mycena amicta]